MKPDQLSILGLTECDPERLSDIHYKERSPPVIGIQILVGVGKERKTKANYLTKLKFKQGR